MYMLLSLIKVKYRLKAIYDYKPKKVAQRFQR